jgi:hypothetical protein
MMCKSSSLLLPVSDEPTTGEIGPINEMTDAKKHARKTVDITPTIVVNGSDEKYSRRAKIDKYVGGIVIR